MAEPGGWAEEVLGPAPDRLDLLARLGAGVLVLVDASGQVAATQPADGTLLGYPADGLLGWPALDLVHPDDRALARRALDALTGKEPPGPDQATEVRLAHADGSWRWVEVSATAVPVGTNGSSGADRHAAAVLVTDTTDRRQAEDRIRASEARFRALVERSQDVFVIANGDGEVTYVSPSVELVLGLPPGEFAAAGKGLVHPDDLAQPPEAEALITTDPSARPAVRLRHRDGGWRWFEVTGVDLLHDPRVGGMVYTLRLTVPPESGWGDRRDSRLLAIAEATKDLVVLLEPNLDGVYLNPSARRFFGVPDERPSDFDARSHVSEETRQRWHDVVLPALTDAGSWQGELDLIDGEGRSIPMEVEIIAHLDDRGEMDVVSGIGRDVGARKELEARLQHEATHDPLTRLPNRALFADRLEVAIGRAQRSRRPPAVLFCDLDRFKVINDSLGHDIGDRVLIELAERLLTSIRPGDTVARFGGDEFLVLCEDLNTEAEAVAIAERVGETLNRPVIVDDRELVVSASIGIAYTDEPGTPEELLRDADAAMYEAKDRGRRRAEVHDSGMRQRADDRLALEADLRRVLGRDQLAVHYQPQISLSTGRIVGAEALLRWEHPERGLLLPAQFLPVAEDAGLIGPIGLWLAGQAVGAAERLQQARASGDGSGDGDLLVSMNLSASQLADEEFAAELRAVLSEADVEPARVGLEIAEELLGDDVDVTDAALGRLRGIGVRISVDDFGPADAVTGQFHRLPVDLLKVDPALVGRLGSDDGSVVQAVVDLAHGLGIQAVAVGVETAAQLAALRRIGCDLAQGYFIAHPMPEADLAELLASDPVWWIFDADDRSGVWSGWQR